MGGGGSLKKGKHEKELYLFVLSKTVAPQRQQHGIRAGGPGRGSGQRSGPEVSTLAVERFERERRGTGSITMRPAKSGRGVRARGPGKGPGATRVNFEETKI